MTKIAKFISIALALSFGAAVLSTGAEAAGKKHAYGKGCHVMGGKGAHHKGGHRVCK